MKVIEKEIKADKLIINIIFSLINQQIFHLSILSRLDHNVKGCKDQSIKVRIDHILLTSIINGIYLQLIGSECHYSMKKKLEINL